MSTSTAPRPDFREIPVADVAPCPFQARRFQVPDDQDENLRELADSIKTHGVLQPILVREVANGFELAGGERRLRASKLAGVDTIPARILDLDDDALAEVTAIENLQRQDLTPLEEADAIGLLLDRAGWNYEAVASQLGYSVATVGRRARLRSLSEAWREVVADPNHPASSWSRAHLLAIATLEPDNQDEILSRNRTQARNWFWQQTASSLRVTIDRYCHRLVRAPWSPKDEELVPEAGSCAACTRRSSCVPGLFVDQMEDPDSPAASDDRCLDASCWDAKMEAWLGGRIAQLRKRHGRHLVLVGSPTKSFDLGKTISEFTVDRCKKSDEGARPCLKVSGADIGEYFWGQISRFGSSAAEPAPDPHRHLTAQLDHLMSSLSAEIAGPKRPPVTTMVPLLLVAGFIRDASPYEPEPFARIHEMWSRLDYFQGEGLAACADAAWEEKILPQILSRLASLSRLTLDRGESGESIFEETLQAARRWAEFFEIEFDPLLEAAQAAFPDTEAEDGSEHDAAAAA